MVALSTGSRRPLTIGALASTSLLGSAPKSRRRKFSVPLLVFLIVQGLLVRHYWSGGGGGDDDELEGTKAALARIWPSPWDRPAEVGAATTSTALRKRTDRALDVPFPLSVDPLPVHHIHEQIHFHNHPLSPHRPPSNQFLLSPKAVSGGRLRRTAPVISIITATQNPRAIMLETAASVLGQSLQNVEWVIVDDHTTDPDSLAMLREIAKDPRVVIVPNTGDKGLSASRNVALRWILSDDKLRAGRRPKYLASLDDDDLYELTALEKVRPCSSLLSRSSSPSSLER